MKHCGVVTDKDVFWDFFNFDDRGNLMQKVDQDLGMMTLIGKTRKELYQEHFFDGGKRIYSDEVEMADLNRPRWREVIENGYDGIFQFETNS